MNAIVRTQVLFFLGGSLSSLAAAGGYSVTEIGMGGVDLYAPISINNSGQAAINFGGTAYFYSGGSLTAVPGPTSGVKTYAQNIGNDGTVMGNTAHDTSAFDRGFISSGGVTTQFSTLQGYSTVTDRNASGLTVGTSEGVISRIAFNRAVVFNGSTITQLPQAGGTYGNSAASAVNSSGVIVGYTTFNEAEQYYLQKGAIWTNGNLSFVPEFGGLTSDGVPYNNSQAIGITDGGDILVNQDFAGAGTLIEHATLLRNGVYTDLGDLGGGVSSGSRINNSSEVVGTSTLADGSQASFLWTATGGMTNLSAQVVGPYWSSFKAWDINDNGQIIGYAKSAITGQYRALILTPVPEPTSMVALGLGAVALLRRRKR